MTLLLDFADVTDTMLADVGGKALNLGRLSQAGLPVPDGFCVTTEAYRLAVDHRLDDVLRRLAEPELTPGGLNRLAEEARQAVAGAALAEDLRQQVGARYRRLGVADAPVAVRSSATAEDLPFASFAGQQDTYLNVVGEDALLTAIRRCWASLWTDRAVSYRAANGIDHAGVALAVVVQRMLDAEVAGVLFTANPVTGHRGQTVIEASPGLGESVVSGAVNPDRFVVDSASGTILQAQLGDKLTAVRALAGGGTRIERLPATADRACLSAAQVAQLVALGQRVQDHYGQPQDTEWAIAHDGRLWLTQARPITTLYPVPETRHTDVRAFLCLTLAQGLTRPITPMGIAAFRMIGSSVAAVAGYPVVDVHRGPAGLAFAGQRAFVDLTPPLRHRRARRAITTVFGVMEARTSTVIRQLTTDPRFTPVDSHGAGRILARILWRNQVPLRMLTAAVSPRLAYWGVERIGRRLRGRLTLPADATAEQRLDHVELLLQTAIYRLMPSTFGYAAAGLALLAVARRLLSGVADYAETFVVLRGLPHNVTTEMDLDLWRVSQTIRADETAARVFTERSGASIVEAFRAHALPPVAQRAMTDFLARYGHRAVAEIDLGMPRWSDEPDHLVGVITNYLRLADERLAPDVQFARGAEEAEQATSDLERRAAKLSPLRGWVVGWSLRRARALVGLRESPKFFLVLALAGLRDHLRHVGRAASAAGAIDSADDVFWLDLLEARRALRGERFTAVVAERRAAYERELRRRHIPRVLLSDGTEPEATLPRTHDASALTGSPASTGTVTARARVVLDPVGAHLEPGEILVAPSTDPGWTPLFLTAGGLVMEMGGSNSHGAVVAREYGIPAVVGVPEATQRIVTGQVVTVDGAAGRVVLAEPVAVA